MEKLGRAGQGRAGQGSDQAAYHAYFVTEANTLKTQKVIWWTNQADCQCDLRCCVQSYLNGENHTHKGSCE